MRTIEYETAPGPSSVKRPSNARIAEDVVPMAGLAAASLALSGAVIIRRPDLVMSADFLFQDAGHNLLVTDKMLSGASLYSDVFYPYGPVSDYLYALVVSLFGNTPTVYLSLLAGISAVNICLAYLLIRRVADRRTRMSCI